MATSAYLLPEYRIISAQPKRPDVVVLVKNTVAQYAEVVSSVGRMSIAEKVELPGHCGFEVINVHGPFSKA